MYQPDIDIIDKNQPWWIEKNNDTIKEVFDRIVSLSLDKHGDKLIIIGVFNKFANNRNINFIVIYCKECNKLSVTSINSFRRSITGCKYCGYKRTSKVQKNSKKRTRVSYSSFDEVTKYAQEIHNDKYHYIRILPEKMIEYRCKKCNTINTQLIGVHINSKSGCIKCANVKRKISIKKSYRNLRDVHGPLTFEQYADKIRLIHGDKFECLYFKKDESKKYIVVRCNRCGEILSIPHNYLIRKTTKGCLCYHKRRDDEDRISNSVSNANIV